MLLVFYFLDVFTLKPSYSCEHHRSGPALQKIDSITSIPSVLTLPFVPLANIGVEETNAPVLSIETPLAELALVLFCQSAFVLQMYLIPVQNNQYVYPLRYYFIIISTANAVVVVYGINRVVLPSFI